MRNNSSNRRPRGRNNNNGGQNNNNNNNHRRQGNNRSQVFDSNGPDVRIRGTAHQVHEKYQALAKDATSSGDYVLAESYLQHAEHYQRLISSWNAEDDAKKAQQAANNPETQQAQQDQKSETDETPKQVKPRAKSQRQDQDDLGLPQSMLTPSPIGGDAMQDA